MNEKQVTIPDQLRRNAVAIISLVVALSSLGYNTWRNEQTEANRNYRFAAFEILVTLGKLQQVVFHAHYDKDADKGNPRTGWAYVLTVRDLAAVLPAKATAPMATERLLQVWSNHWEGLGQDDNAAKAVMAALEQTRDETLRLLRSLD